jgi:aminoglycoside 6-adenylyltransferase
MATHDLWLEQRVIPWATRDANVRALAVLGSRGHAEPVDEWADMDLLLLVRDRHAILDRDDWLDAIGPHWIALRHPGPFPDLPVKQVLFEGGLDFDIVPLEAGTLTTRSLEPHVGGLLGGGLGPMLDKDGELASLQLPPPAAPARTDIDETEFDFIVRDFLFQTVWAAKHLRRGELWAAKDDVDGYMKGDLVRLIECHAIAHGATGSIRGGGRHLEEWADPRIVTAAPAIFARYDAPSVAAALVAMIDLFEWVGVETARALGFSYPAGPHAAVAAWVRECVRPLTGSSS